MAETRVLAISSDTVIRREDDGTGGQGCGGSKHLYAGRYGGSGTRRNYDSFLKFTLDWSGVKSITSAVLNIYTDEYDNFGPAGEVGLMAPPSSGERPKVYIRRLTSAFVEGNNADGVFDSSDYTNPNYTTSNSVSKVLTPTGPNLLNTIDITDIVKSWAPSSVAGGGQNTNYGIGIFGTNTASENWSGWAQEHTGGGGAAERPSITLTYELGPTIPFVPGTSAPTLTPSGTVASLSQFEGGFSDVRPTDKLQSTSIEMYDAGAAATGDAGTNNITRASHGLKVGDIIYFTSLTGGTGLSTFTRYYVRVVASTSAFRVSTTPTGSSVDITVDYSAMTYSKLLRSFSKVATNSERTANAFIVPKPTDFNPSTGVTYRWRARYTDTEGETSAWSALVSFVLSNTAPNPPILKPVTGSSFASLNLVKFQGGTFVDANGDQLQSHQVQLSPFPSGDIRWDEEDGILWDSGQVFDSLGATSWTELYGGQALAAGTYYWRARHWDMRNGVSSWTYATIILTAAFSPDPASYDSVQIDPKAPWRIIIRNLLQADGVTPTVRRAPGQVVAIFEEAKNVGASIVYNSPGELHFTLLKDDQQISVVEPKQTHYAVEFYSGDGWQEKFAGVIWDVDATETDVVFKGIDYLGLYDTVIDERYDPLKPNKSYKLNGSYYSNVTIRNIILDQLNWARKLPDSWVGFISIGSIATMGSKTTVYSTMQPTLSFVAGLIDSHRQGTGKRTRMKVVKTTTGGYQLQIVDDPGVIRSDLAMYYGELVQGYRIIFFGQDWANVQHVIGRNRDGVKVVYKTIKDKAFQPATSLYGRIATVAVIDGVQDQNDLNRRGLQAAIQSAKLGKQVAIGIRTVFLAPLQGWDVCDIFPLKILDGAVDTDAFGSGFWAAYACAWEATDIGQQSLVITFMPREDATPPDASLIPSVNVSTQPEWQLGWTPPDPLKVSSLYWLDQSTGKIYLRNDTNGTLVPVTGTP